MGDNETEVDMDMEIHESQILANLNILQGEEPIYQMKQLKDSMNEQPKTFFTSLP